MAGLCMGHAIEKLIAHFSRATSSSTAASEEVAQPADETKEPEDTAEGIAGLCKLVDNAGKVDLSICARPIKVCITRGGVQHCCSCQLKHLHYGQVQITCSNKMYFLK